METTPGELVAEIRHLARSLTGIDVRDVPADDLGDLIIQMEQARANLDAAASRLLARFDTERCSQIDGLRTTRSWLAHRCQMSGATAARRVAVARLLSDLPVVAERFGEGRLSFDQAEAFARARNPRTAGAMTEDEVFLADLADALRVDQLASELRGWAEMVDTDGAEPDPGHLDRGFSLAQTFDSSWSGRLDLSSAEGTLLHEAVKELADEFHEHDRREGAADPGLARTPAQRRADALVELVRRGRCADSARGSASVGLTLLLPAEDLEAGRGAETAGGHHVTPSATHRLTCDATVTPLTWTRSGTPLDAGRARRLVTPKQRQALALRDGGCTFPGCPAPPDECDAHHLRHWAQGGPSDMANLGLACGYHHTLAHEGGYLVKMGAHGTPEWFDRHGHAVDPRPGWNHSPPPPPTPPPPLPTHRAA
jgi:hypothetical protein